MTQVQIQPAAISHSALHQPRVALICDFREENWPSMDLVGNMVFEHLEGQFRDRLRITKICPPMRQRLGRFPILGRLPIANNADRLLNRFADYSRFLKPQLERFDLFHLIDHSYGQLVHDLPSGRTIVTCHDLDTFRCLLQPEQESRPRWFRAMVERILSGFQKAAHVLAVSASTRDELLRYGLFPAERVTVVPNGLHPAFSATPHPAADSELSQLLQNHFLLQPDAKDTAWLLSVGSTIRRKRLDLLLQIFAQVRLQAPEVRLLRIGEPFTEEQRKLANELGIADAITELGSVPSHVLSAAYRRAALLLQTSDAEGFGLPLIEAMACGCPVIASDLPVLREVGGSAATYCPVGDIATWSNVILLALAGPKRGARESGLANAARFSWAENAAQTARIYEKVIGRER